MQDHPYNMYEVELDNFSDVIDMAFENSTINPNDQYDFGQMDHSNDEKKLKEYNEEYQMEIESDMESYIIKIDY